MAPLDFPKQTDAILECLFHPYEKDPALETDGPGDDFDPLTIAKKLQELGDHYDETVIQPLMKDVRAAAKDQVKTTFCNSVENLSKMWVTESAEVAPEKQLLKATITLAVYMRNNCPDMTDVIKEAASNIINTRLSSWILQQGGWKMASGSCN